jgi:23S rRNA (adenine2030-N6)-methyltransferase
LVHYRHRYHAGNFADVFKHALVCALLEAMCRKLAPWCYLETHAGAGRYELDDEGAQATGEWRAGVARVYAAADAPATAAGYLLALREFNGGATLRRYPGSPWLALRLARAQDRLVFCERVPEVASALKATLAGDARTAVHVRDGYEAVSLLPPRERRGLVLVDAPFERADEFDALAEFLAAALRRFAGGVYAAWYPLKNAHAADRFVRAAARIAGKPALDLRLDTGAPGAGQLRRCGLTVINAPHGFSAQARAILAWLTPRLAQGPRAGFRVNEMESR